MATRWSDRLNMFRSARLKLTLFYLAIIAIFNLVVTLSVRVYAEHEFLRSNNAQRSEVREWVIRFIDGPMPRSDVTIQDIQEEQAAIVRQHLNQGLFVINMCALLLGGALSYWFAGRTLRPLQEAHESQARFTADASHELRTPLANMRLENEVFLRQKHFTEEEGREQLASNLEEIQRLERLSSNLLLLHQYGQAALARSSVRARRIVDEAVRQITPTAEVKKVQVETDVADKSVLVHRESMVQVMDILLDNALKYGAKGGEVTVTGHEKNGKYIISIKDKGPGLAAQDIPHLFDRLYRGDKARSTHVPGYGLGLALAKEIAQANGATITARNNHDGGACFEICMEPAPRKAP
ncbi:MAG TPA: HAMP domain-containing sensor histidine kinase [Candidatus Saccharimonadales bacterium]